MKKSKLKLRDIILIRVNVAFVIAAILVLAIMVKMLHLQIVEYDRWKEQQDIRIVKEKVIEASRGQILSREGKVLSSSVPRYTPRIDFKTDAFNDTLFEKKVDSLAIELSSYFKNKSVKDYKSYLLKGYESKGRAFPIVRNKLDYFDLQALKAMPFLKERKKYTGFYQEEDLSRKKPFAELASRTIGEIDSKKHFGLYGIEHAYNKELSGVKGKVQSQRINGKRVDRVLSPAVDGNDVVTTIDITLQDVAETALLKQLSKNEAGHGCAIVMEVETGDIMAIANLKRGNDGLYRESYNYAIGELSEPGSTFKLASFMAILEDGGLNLDDEINTRNGKIKYYGHTLKDSHEGGYGKISAKRVFEVSSNVGTSYIIHKYYKDRPQDFIKRLTSMGLSEGTGIEIKGEENPFITHPSSKSWSGLSLPWMSIGYEVRLSPMQILTFYNAVANNGKMVKPRFVSEIRNNGEVIRKNKVKVLKSSICSKRTLKQAHELLAGVVENGTARNLKSAHLKIAGKTGTAQIAKLNTGYTGNGGKEYSASFCGYFPADNPKYSCIVVVKAPTRSVFYGNLVAGPVFREIADKVYAMNTALAEDDTSTIEVDFKVPVTLDGNKNDLLTVLKGLEFQDKVNNSNATWVRTYNKKDHIEVRPLNVSNNTVPNVKGMGAKDAVFLLEQAGLKVELKGVGRVVKQSIQPGARIRSSRKIIIQLS